MAPKLETSIFVSMVSHNTNCLIIPIYTLYMYAQNHPAAKTQNGYNTKCGGETSRKSERRTQKRIKR